MKRFASIIFTIAILAGTLLPFSAILSTAHAETTAGTTVDNSYTPGADVQGYLDDCTINPFAGEGKSLFPGCLEQFVYYIPYTFGSWAMSIAAEIFDAAANLTLSSTLYTTGSNFLEKGWTVTRDFANIFFILVLLFIALSLILDIEVGHANPKKMIASVVVIAIFINFSFFMTEVIIDISNSLALVFYNQISVVNDRGQTVNNDDVTKQVQGNKYINATSIKPLSIALVKSFTPQVFSDKKFYDDLAQVGSRGFFTATNNKPPAKDAKIDAIVIIPIMLLVGLMFLVVAYSFTVALISLIGRLIGLWIAIVFAPLAFISKIIPSTSSIPGFGWDEWFSSLWKNAFAAPIYFFFLLLISLLTQVSIVPHPVPSTMSPGILLVLVIIQFAIVMTMLLQATKYVKTAAGEIGNMVLKATQATVGAATGLAIGTAAGAVALGGQATAGFVGKKLANSNWASKWASGEVGKNWFTRNASQFIGEHAVKSGQFLSKSSFDARHTGLANALSSATGIGLGSFGALAAAKTAGGLEAAAARKAEKDAKFAESLRQNSTQEATLKKLKGARDKDLDVTEAENRINLQLKENIDAEVRTQETIRREANDLMKTLRATGGIGTPQYIAAETAYNDANARLNGGALSTGAVIAANDALKTDAEFRRVKTAASKEKIDRIKSGERAPDGSQRIVAAGETKADGTVADARDVLRKVIKKEDLSISDLEKLMENSKKAPGRAYLAYQAEHSGYHTEVFRDKLGNTTGFHVDTNQAGTRNFTRALLRVGIAGAVGGLSGNIGLLTSAVTGLQGALGFGLVAAIREGLAEAGGGRAGSSIVAGEAAHHTAEPGGKHEHEHGVYQSPNKGFFDMLRGIFSGGGGGGGGGGHKAAPAHH